MTDDRSAEKKAPLLSAQGLQVEFQTDHGPVLGVEDVSFEVFPGETVCIVGESGSGKSVTSLSLMRLVEFGGGRIAGGRLNFTRADGQVVDIAALDAEAMVAIRGGEIGMVFQEPMTALNPVMTIEGQLVDAILAHRSMPASAARGRALDLLRSVQVPEPERRLRQFPHELSGGLRQRIVIAIAIASEPRLLIADEPTTALDVTIQAEILALIDRLKREKGMAVLFITHDMAVVAQLADRVIVMYGGRIVEEGRVEAIFESPRESYTHALLAAVPKLGAMRGRVAPEPMPILGAAQPPPSHDLATITLRGKALLDVRHLTTRFPVKGGMLRLARSEVHAVQDVSFSIGVGETFSLVGESGCGKSSCGRSILRLVEASAGEISLDGWDIRGLAPADLRRARRDMQMVFQDPFASLNPHRRLRDQVAEPLINFGLASGSALTQRVAELFEQVELPKAFLARFPHELSGGQRQRIAIARALATQPKLIVADEAVSALDVSVRAQILNLMMQLQAELGLSFLFISHDMAVVERVSHHVGVMYLGRIVELGTRAAIFEDPRHPYTRQLLSAVPIADPRQRRAADNRVARHPAVQIHPVGYEAPPSLYDEVGPGHFVLRA